MQPRGTLPSRTRWKPCKKEVRDIKAAGELVAVANIATAEGMARIPADSQECGKYKIFQNPI